MTYEEHEAFCFYSFIFALPAREIPQITMIYAWRLI